MLPNYLRLAIKLAEQNPYYPKWRLASLLCKGGAVQQVGFSKKKNDPLTTDPDFCSVHAEIDATFQRTDLSRHTLYVARVGKKNDPRLAKPCQNCREMLYSKKIKQVIFSIDENTYGVWKP